MIRRAHGSSSAAVAGRHDEDPAAARRVARPGRVERPGDREHVDVRIAGRVERVVRAAEERLQAPAVLRRRLLDERDANGVRPGRQRTRAREPRLDVVAGQRRGSSARP